MGFTMMCFLIWTTSHPATAVQRTVMPLECSVLNCVYRIYARYTALEIYVEHVDTKKKVVL